MMAKSKPGWRDVVNSWNFRVWAAIVWVGVTFTFYSNFRMDSSSVLDALIYWSIYLGCMIAMLGAVFVIARRQL